MGDCTKYVDWKVLPCPEDYDIEELDDGRALVTVFVASGGPDEPVIFNSAKEAEDYAEAQKFAYELLVKIAKENRTFL